MATAARGLPRQNDRCYALLCMPCLFSSPAQCPLYTSPPSFCRFCLSISSLTRRRRFELLGCVFVPAGAACTAACSLQPTICLYALALLNPLPAVLSRAGHASGVPLRTRGTCLLTKHGCCNGDHVNGGWSWLGVGKNCGTRNAEAGVGASGSHASASSLAYTIGPPGLPPSQCQRPDEMLASAPQCSKAGTAVSASQTSGKSEKAMLYAAGSGASGPLGSSPFAQPAHIQSVLNTHGGRHLTKRRGINGKSQQSWEEHWGGGCWGKKGGCAGGGPEGEKRAAARRLCRRRLLAPGKNQILVRSFVYQRLLPLGAAP